MTGLSGNTAVRIAAEDYRFLDDMAVSHEVDGQTFAVNLINARGKLIHNAAILIEPKLATMTYIAFSNNETLHCHPDQEFFTADKEWVRARDLTAGAYLWGENPRLRRPRIVTIGVTYKDRPVTMYSLNLVDSMLASGVPAGFLLDCGIYAKFKA